MPQSQGFSPARHRGARLDDELLELGVNVEPSGTSRQRAADELDGLARDGRRDLGRVALGAALEALPRAREHGGPRRRLPARGHLELGLELVTLARRERVGLFDGDGRVTVGQRVLPAVVEVGRADRRLARDRAVHDRLRVRRLVALVVPVLAVAPQLDERVAVEALPEVDGEIDDLADGLGILAVDVEDRDLEHARDVGRVGRRLGVLRRGREADLVVDDDVDGAAHAVAVELRHVERLGDDALAREGRVAVEQERQAARAAAVADAVLLGAHAALHDGVDPLEVARVERERQVDLVRVRAVRAGERPIDRVAEVVLHVAARALVGRSESCLSRNSAKICEGGFLSTLASTLRRPRCAMPMTISTTFERAARSMRRSSSGMRLSAALHREALGAEELVLEELLEDLGADDLLEQAHAVGAREREPVARALHAALQPPAQLDVVQVGELDADLCGV